MKKRTKMISKLAVSITIAISMLLIMLTGCTDKKPEEAAKVNPAQTTATIATYTDLAGKTVKVTTNVQRIVLLRSRDIYELSAILGDEISEKLVGWGPDLKNKDNDGYKKFTEAFPKLKTLQDTGDVQSDAVSVETMLNLKPDLIVADQYMLDEFQSVKKLIEAGLPVVCIDESTDPLATPQKGIRLLGKILGKESRADEIADYADLQVKKIYETIATINDPKPSVYLECGDTGPKTFSDTYSGSNDQSWGTVLGRLRVNNIAEGAVQGMAQINPELVISKNPEIIVITGQNWTSASDSMRLGFYADKVDSKARLKAFATRAGWNELSAIKNNRVYSVFHNLSMHIFDFVGLQALAKDFYPNQFKDLDPEQNLKTFFEKYMPITYSGMFSLSLAE